MLSKKSALTWCPSFSGTQSVTSSASVSKCRKTSENVTAAFAQQTLSDETNLPRRRPAQRPTRSEKGKHIPISSTMSSNHFGWSLSDSVDDPRRTGLANFRQKLLLLHQFGTTFDDPEDSTSDSAMADRQGGSDETLTVESPTGRRVLKPYYRREHSVSQGSDSCFGSEYPSLTSTGSSEPETPAKMARTSWMAPSGTSRSTTTWAASMDDTSRASSGPSSTSTDCWRGSIHHALAVMEHRGEEISSLFDQLHEIETDLTSMNNQVGQVSHSLQQCKRRPGRHPQPSPIYSSQSVSSLHRQNSFSSFTSRHNRRSSVSSCRELNNLTEDEMEYIVHRLLKRICELSLGRQEGRDDIPLIV